MSLSSTTKSNTNKKRTYKESCDQLYDCYVEYGLLCEYGWNETKSCLCEGSHYWSAQQNKCRKTEEYSLSDELVQYVNIYPLVRKGEINELCDIDYQCHREIGLVCDKPPGVSTKICVNLFFISCFPFESSGIDIGLCSEYLLGKRFELW
jgi:hypothetical protein